MANNMVPTKVIQLSPQACLKLYEHVIPNSIEDVKEVVDRLRVQSYIKFKIMGKECTMHRRQLMFGKSSYAFSGTKVEVDDGVMPALIVRCMKVAEEIDAEMSPNAALGALYTADDYISPHRDNESKHRPGAPIIGFSFGETRKLVVKSYKRTRDDSEYKRVDLELPHGSAYVMEGARFQKDFTHEVGKGKNERVSITVRQFC